MFKTHGPFFVCALLVLTAFLLCACSNQTTEIDGTDIIFPTQTHPQGSDVSPSVTDVNSIEGGSFLKDANLRSISAESSQDGSTLSISFVSGSLISAGTKESPATDIPKYEVYMLSAPSRLVVEFDGVLFWDHFKSDDFSSDYVSHLHLHKHYDKDKLSLYFQLNHASLFSVSKNGGTLKIELNKAETTSEGEFFVAANLYRALSASTDYTMGELLAPAISKEGELIMLSSACKTQDEANALKTKLMNTAKDFNVTFTQSDWHIISNSANDAPSFTSAMKNQAVFSALPARFSNAPTTLTPVLINGFYLADFPGGGIIYTKDITSYDISGESYSYEQLWFADANTDRAFLDYQFQTIESVRFSPDGRRLAVLERAEETTHLFVFDTDSRDLLTDLSAMGLGDMINAYTWDSVGGRLFTVSGSGAINIHQYDFNVPDERNRHTVVDNNGADGNSISYHGGEVYFTHAKEDTGSFIYRIKPEGGLRREFFAAEAFTFSSDGNVLAFSVPASGSYISQKPRLALYVMDTDKYIEINSDFSVYNFFFSDSGSELYFFENRLAGESGEGADEVSTTPASTDAYPYRLHVYDIASATRRVVGDFTSTTIYAGNAGLYVCYADDTALGLNARATYLIK